MCLNFPGVRNPMKKQGRKSWRSRTYSQENKGRGLSNQAASKIISYLLLYGYLLHTRQGRGDGKEVCTWEGVLAKMYVSLWMIYTIDHQEIRTCKSSLLSTADPQYL